MDPSPLLPSPSSLSLSAVRSSPSSSASSSLTFHLPRCLTSPLLLYLRRHPLHCLRSLLSFNDFAVLSYALLLLHCLLLYLSSLTLFLALCPPAASLPFPFLLYTAFTAVRSLAHLPLIIGRIRRPSLWSSTSPHQALIHCLLTLSRLLSVAFFAYALLYSALLMPGLAGEGWALPLCLCALLVRDGLALALPAVAVAALRWWGGRRADQVSPFLPFYMGEWQALGEGLEAVEVEKGRGLSEEELQALGGVELWVTGRCVDGACAVCLVEMEGGESVRRLCCGHSFHQPCIDQWLVRRRSCPKCVQTVSRCASS